MKTKTLDELKEMIKQLLIVDQLKLEDITAEEIEDEMSLFGDGLGLDSIEAFEMIIGMEQIFGVNVKNVPADKLKEHMYSVQSLAQFLKNEMNEVTA